MNKKGFTLVELLGVIAVLAIIAMLVFPSIGDSIDSKKEKELNKVIDIVESAGKAYFSFNDDIYKVDIDTLKEEDYVTKELINPNTEEKLDGCVRKTLDSENIFTYTYGNCNPIEVPFSAVMNGGTPSQEFKQTYQDGTIIKLLEPTHSTKQFNGWQIVKGNSILKGDTLIIGTTETIIYAKWENKPKLTVDLNGGSDNTDYAEYYKTGAIIELEVPTKVGYTFIGWEQLEGNSTISGNTVTMGSENTKIKANWKANTNTAYTVKHWTQNLGAETTQNSTNYTLNSIENKTGTTSSCVTPAVKTITGFTSPSTQTKTILADGSLVVNYYYTRKSYIYTLGSSTGVSTSGSTTSGSYQYGTTITLKASASIGYTWRKWTSSNTSLVSDKITANTTFTMPAGNITMIPNVTINTYTISYNLNGGTAGSSAPTSGTYGSTVSISNPSRAGYAFTGWSVSGEGAILNGTNLTIGASNITLTANWKSTRLYLVQNGTMNSIPSKHGSGTFSISGNTVTVGAGSKYGGYFWTIDLTNYNTLYMNCYGTWSDDDNSAEIGVFNPGVDPVVITTQDYGETSFTYAKSIDVSGLSGTYLIGVKVRSGQGGGSGPLVYTDVYLST